MKSITVKNVKGSYRVANLSNQPGGFRATYKGETIGWYATTRDALIAIERARQADVQEEQDWLNKKP